MYRHARHRLIADLLSRMRADVLEQTHCYFGGGTAASLLLGEYRESTGIDFLVSHEDGYRWLRNHLQENSLEAIFTAPDPLAQGRSVRMDRYGIRSFLSVGDVTIKFEIVSENRIELRGVRVPGLGVPVLDKCCLIAEKLLALADRWADASTHQRDLIDLAMMDKAWPEVLGSALKLAQVPYGASVYVALRKASLNALEKPDRLRDDLRALKMDTSSIDAIAAFARARAHDDAALHTEQEVDPDVCPGLG